MVVIFPCAGQSSRFPGTRPKYLLTDYSGMLMVERASMNVQSHKHFVILKEHIDKYDAENIMSDCFRWQDHSITVLNMPTNGPAETVYLALKGMKHKGSFLVRDCDSFFDFDSVQGNVIYTSRLKENSNLKGVSQLSYVVTNEQDIVTNIVEKTVASDQFCVGGYQFEDVEDYYYAYETIRAKTNEIFISDVIQYMINTGKVFISKDVRNYENVGVLDAWLEFNDRPTIFCDIDGVIVENQGTYGKNSYDNKQYVPITENVECLKRKLEQDCQIVFTTARSGRFYGVTRTMLDDLGFKKCRLLMDINHSKRIVINDFASSNPYPAAVAINLERNSNRLKDYLT